MWQKFWDWYDRHYRLNIAISAFLFLWQIIHLYWLTTDVVWGRLTGNSLFSPSPFWEWLLILVDYTEVPALLSTSLLYISELRRAFSWKNVWFLFSVNSQWLHLFWITDEFVLETFRGVTSAILPLWLAWVAILIDYLELPVIFDTSKKFVKNLLDGRGSP